MPRMLFPACSTSQAKGRKAGLWPERGGGHHNNLNCHHEEEEEEGGRVISRHIIKTLYIVYVESFLVVIML